MKSNGEILNFLWLIFIWSGVGWIVFRPSSTLLDVIGAVVLGFVLSSTVDFSKSKK